MKVILYMGVSINGYIAKSDGNSEWTSDEDLEGFFDNSRRSGNIIMGKNTFHAANNYGYFPFPEAVNVVVTHEKLENIWDDNVIFTDKSPKEVLAMLEEKGFASAFLAGGGLLNSSFAKEKLIDEIYLDIEPLLFGKGVSVFAPTTDFEFELKLLEVNKLNDDTVQLHYAVIK